MANVNRHCCLEDDINSEIPYNPFSQQPDFFSGEELKDFLIKNNKHLSYNKEEEVNGSQKISLYLLDKLGTKKISAVDMNAVIYFASTQDMEGRTFTNRTLLSQAIGCHPSLFSTIMMRLYMSGIITFKRSVSYHTSINGIYEVHLLGNDLSTEEKRKNGYIRLNHDIFHSIFFRRTTKAAKYCILDLFYAFAIYSKKELDVFNQPIIINYNALIERIMNWGHYTRREASNAFLIIKRKYKTEFVSNKYGKMCEISIPVSDIRFNDTDDFAMYTNLILNVFMEEGINLNRYMSTNKVGKFISRNKTLLQDKIEKANNDFAKSMSSISEEEINNLRKEYTEINSSLKKVATSHAIKDGHNYAWNKKELKSKIITQSSLSVWLKYILSKILESYYMIDSFICQRSQMPTSLSLYALLDEAVNKVVSGRKFTNQSINKLLFSSKAEPAGA